MTGSPLSEEEGALLADAVRRGAVRITLSTRGQAMPGGGDRLAMARRLEAAGLLSFAGEDEHGASREDQTAEFTPTAAGRRLFQGD